MLSPKTDSCGDTPTIAGQITDEKDFPGGNAACGPPLIGSIWFESTILLASFRPSKFLEMPPTLAEADGGKRQVASYSRHCKQTSDHFLFSRKTSAP